MKILFSIAVLSFLALAFAALAIARHIRKGGAKAAKAPADHELSEAIDLRLHDLARPSQSQRAAPAPPQDFSYFNKEAPARPPAESSDPAKAAANQRI